MDDFNGREAIVCLLERVAFDKGCSPYLAHSLAVEVFEENRKTQVGKPGAEKLLRDLDSKLSGIPTSDAWDRKTRGRV